MGFLNGVRILLLAYGTSKPFILSFYSVSCRLGLLAYRICKQIPDGVYFVMLGMPKKPIPYGVYFAMLGMSKKPIPYGVYFDTLCVSKKLGRNARI